MKSIARAIKRQGRVFVVCPAVGEEGGLREAEGPAAALAPPLPRGPKDARTAWAGERKVGSERVLIN